MTRKKKPPYRGFHQFVKGYHFPRSNPFDVTPTTNAFAYEEGSFVSTVTPGYKDLKKRRRLPINPHSATYGYIQIIPSSCERYDKDLVNGRIYRFNAPPFPNLSDAGLVPDGSFDPLNTTVRLAIKDSSINLGVALGELKNTARFLNARVGGPIRLLSSFLKKKHSLPVPPYVLKGDRWVSNPFYRPSSHKTFADTLANSWLEYSYAFRPLLNDIYGAANVLATYPDRSRQFSVKRKLRIVNYNTTNSGGWTINSIANGTRSICLHCYTENPLSRSFSSLGVINPLSVAWELVPYSFVADWFYPLGKTLDSLDAGIGIVVTDGYQVTAKTTLSQGRYLRDDTLLFHVGDALIQRTSYTRVKLSGLPPVALPQFRFPSLFSQAASGCALLHQLFRR